MCQFTFVGGCYCNIAVVVYSYVTAFVVFLYSNSWGKKCDFCCGCLVRCVWTGLTDYVHVTIILLHLLRWNECNKWGNNQVCRLHWSILSVFCSIAFLKCTHWKKTNDGKLFVFSYLLVSSLYVSIMAPLHVLNVTVCKCIYFRRSAHGRLLQSLSNFVALWTFYSSCRLPGPFMRDSIVN